MISAFEDLAYAGALRAHGTRRRPAVHTIKQPASDHRGPCSRDIVSCSSAARTLNATGELPGHSIAGRSALKSRLSAATGGIRPPRAAILAGGINSVQLTSDGSVLLCASAGVAARPVQLAAARTLNAGCATALFFQP